MVGVWHSLAEQVGHKLVLVAVASSWLAAAAAVAKQLEPVLIVVVAIEWRVVDPD